MPTVLPHVIRSAVQSRRGQQPSTCEACIRVASGTGLPAEGAEDRGGAGRMAVQDLGAEPGRVEVRGWDGAGGDHAGAWPGRSKPKRRMMLGALATPLQRFVVISRSQHPTCTAPRSPHPNSVSRRGQTYGGPWGTTSASLRCSIVRSNPS